MNTKFKIVLIIIAIAIFALPTIALGGSFTLSLIEGKTPKEAVQIIAGQIDDILSRIQIIETRQTEQERITACNFSDEALQKAQMEGGIIDADLKDIDELITRITYQRDNSPQDQYQMWQSRLEKVQNIKEQYDSAKEKCGQ